MSEMKINVSIYLEIKDSRIYGGEGTIGYMQTGVDCIVTEEKPRIFKESAYDYVKRTVATTAKICGVSEECIRTISKEEYEENTDD